MPVFWTRRAGARDKNTNWKNRGLLLMLTAMILAPVMDTMAKFLSTDINGVQVVLIRFGFQAVLLLPVILFTLGVQGLKPPKPWVALLRGVFVASAVACFFTSLKWLPVADAMALFFVEPLILTVLSALFLNEKVGWRRLVAVSIGLIGALIVVRPSFEEFGPASLLPIAAAIFFAVYLAMTSKMTKDIHPLTLQFSAGVSACVFMVGVMMAGSFLDFQLLAYHTPNGGQWSILVVIGIIGTISHLMIVFAFKWAPASLLAPFHYLEIVVATVLGYMVFNDFPDALKWLGIAIIIGSGLYVIWREKQVSA